MGNKTPKLIPTMTALMTKRYKNTMATSVPAGTNMGSKYVYVKKPDKVAVKRPEN